LSTRVAAIDTAMRQLELDDGNRLPYDALLLATGALPVKLDLPGADRAQVLTLRTLADCRTIIERIKAARSAVVVGAGFIGMEAAASLRARGVAVHVVAPDKIPMEKVLGAELGQYLRRLHERHGVVFHLGTSLASVGEHSVALKSGETVDADCVIVGIGVRPDTALAQAAGLAIDRGVSVDEYLQTSAPGIYAAGDIARWPDAASGERIRVEHWVVAQRQGQTAARNMLGRRERFDSVPFFWTEQHGVQISYVGHGQGWNTLDIDGMLGDEQANCRITYRRGDTPVALATIGRDLENLRAEQWFEETSASRSR
jgi:NADPH-dependent 2,4-dienoyl-CoA reductase/sulfur reductase-like enzyme